MSKKVYKFPLTSRIAMFIASNLPNKVRASVFIDAYESLDKEYIPIATATEDDGSYSMFSVVEGVRINTLRREAIVDGLKGRISNDKSK